MHPAQTLKGGGKEFMGNHEAQSLLEDEVTDGETRNIEGRLSRLGLGSYGDEAALKSEESRIGKFGMGGFKANLEESQNVSRSILDECVQMVVEERGLLKKDGFKGIFDADDDEVHEGRIDHSKEGAKFGKLPRSSWELLRPSSTPRLSAWLLKAGASEAQVLALFQICSTNVVLFAIY